MKYYCKNCGTEFNFRDNYLTAYGEENCLLCGNDNPDYEMIPIPDYETPAQYEARTENPFPDNGVVWIGQTYISDWEGKEKKIGWLQTNFDISKKIKKERKNVKIVIASPPVPPPDDFVPGEI